MALTRRTRRVLPLILLTLASSAAAHATAERDGRPRIVISSDFPPLDVIPGGLPDGPPEKRADPDDVQSMVRFLVYANEFRVEGLIAASGTMANVARKRNLLDVLDVYDRVDENLRLHDRRFPTAAALRRVTKEGRSGTYGRPASEILGEGKDSEASTFLVELLGRAQADDPIWFCAWGGSQELAQALWRLHHERPAELARAIAGLRVYLIDDQDGSAEWLRREHPGLFIITAKTTFPGLSYLAKGSDRQYGDRVWVARNVREGHGPLGRVYPPRGFIPSKWGVMEGDTPSFLHVLTAARGLGQFNHPEWGGWGGRFVKASSEHHHYVDAPEGPASVTRWQRRIQNDFAARMDWCVRSPRSANHAPIAVLAGQPGTDVVRLRASAGSRVEIAATGSRDPDGQELTYHFWIDETLHTADPQSARIENSDAVTTTLVLPPDARGEVHVVLEVTDAGEPRLVSYRRAVVTIAP